MNITFAQEKIKFGYHSPSGKAKTLDNEEIKKNKREPKLIIPKIQQKNLHNSDVDLVWPGMSILEEFWTRYK